MKKLKHFLNHKNYKPSFVYKKGGVEQAQIEAAITAKDLAREENRKKYIPIPAQKKGAFERIEFETTEEENRIRFLALDSFRHPLLCDTVNTSWYEKTLELIDFIELRAIKSLGWNILSRFSGKI